MAKVFHEPEVPPPSLQVEFLLDRIQERGAFEHSAPLEKLHVWEPPWCSPIIDRVCERVKEVPPFKKPQINGCTLPCAALMIKCNVALQVTFIVGGSFPCRNHHLLTVSKMLVMTEGLYRRKVSSLVWEEGSD